MKIFLKRLAAVGLGLGISLAGVNTAFAATLTWSSDYTVDLASPDINLTILSGSQASSLVVQDDFVQVILGTGDVFTITATDRALHVAGASTAEVDNDCTGGTATVVLTGGAGGETITISTESNPCASGGGSSGGGGSGNNNNPPPSTPLPGVAHSAGSVVKTSDGTVWFITTDGHRRAFTSGGAFLSYGFLSWSMVVDANAADIALPAGSFIPPQDGKIVCSDRTDSYAVKGTCYLITMGKRAAFTSASVFTGQGFKFSRSMTGDVSFMATDANISSATAVHRTGVLVNNAGTIQLVGPSSLMGVPSESVFMSWGYSYLDTVPANAADKALSQSGVMMARVTGQLSPQ
jgi:hypothetical protein